MKKTSDRGYMLVETLLVTMFVAGVLIFLFIQLTSLSNSYEESYKYNTVEGIYSLDNIRNYILDDDEILNYIETNIDSTDYIDISECYYFSNRDYCLKLFEYENIKRIVVLKNQSSYKTDYDINEDMQKFINQISNTDSEKYRLVALFEDSTLATLRFGG